MNDNGVVLPRRWWKWVPTSTLLILCRIMTSTAAPTASPAPIIVQNSQSWDGIDGPWSTFSIRIGEPVQNVRVLPSSAGQATFVILPSGCAANDSVCPESRGGIFNPKTSKSWNDQKFYNLALETNLNYSGNGNYGYEKVGLGVEAAGGPLLSDQVVAAIQTKQFYVGIFGLGPQPTNFSTFDNPKPSFMTTLKSTRQIPSLSWAYTAGAPYRLKKVFGSLTLGGHDTSRYVPNNLTFPFAPDISRDLVVGLQSITATGSSGTNTSLLPSGVLSFVDSTVPHLWLPIEACQAFEKTLNLVYDEKSKLYLVNDSLHDSLVASNYSFTFKLGNTKTGGSTIDIVLPYAAFDLTASAPLVANSSRYFPIKRGDNDTQYALGRTFLQEAYLIADYERLNFSISQASFIDGAKQNIVAIPSIDTPPALPTPAATKPDSGSGEPINPGAIVGIVFGCLITLALFLYAFLRPGGPYQKRKQFAQGQARLDAEQVARDKESAIVAEADKKSETTDLELPAGAPGEGIPEMHGYYDGKDPHVMNGRYAHITFQGAEVEARHKVELPASVTVAEMSGCGSAAEPAELMGNTQYQELDSRSVPHPDFPEKVPDTKLEEPARTFTWERIVPVRRTSPLPARSPATVVSPLTSNSPTRADSASAIVSPASARAPSVSRSPPPAKAGSRAGSSTASRSASPTTSPDPDRPGRIPVDDPPRYYPGAI